MSTTAIVALVLSALICIPIAPVIGVILGVVALRKIGRDPNLKGQTLAIVAIVVGGIGSLLSLGMLPAIAIPAFIKYIRRAKTAEAEDRISEMARSAALYYGQERVSAQGGSLPPQFPESTPLTPQSTCAQNPDGRCQPDPAAWNHPTWQALNFSMDAPHYFRYQFESNGTAFTARALGDLDNDGIFSTFEMAGLGNPDGTVSMARGIYRERPTE